MINHSFSFVEKEEVYVIICFKGEVIL